MTERRYYSVRTGKNPRSRDLDLQTVLGLFIKAYADFCGKQYLDEAGDRLDQDMARKLRKDNLWPIEAMYTRYAEEDLFDVIELLYDYVSQPYYHGWWDYDRDAARLAYRAEINSFLCDYATGYELSQDGEIMSLGAEEMRPLLEQELPEYDPERVDSRVLAAVRKFRHHTPTLEDKQEAVRQLADVLEFLRPKLEGLLPSKEENELFMIANKFGIRHHTADQKTQYEKGIWLDWIFYCYLNTIHVSVNVLKRAEESSQ